MTSSHEDMFMSWKSQYIYIHIYIYMRISNINILFLAIYKLSAVPTGVGFLQQSDSCDLEVGKVAANC